MLSGEKFIKSFSRRSRKEKLEIFKRIQNENTEITLIKWDITLWTGYEAQERNNLPVLVN